MIRKVRVTKWAQKQLDECPLHISAKFNYWVGTVEKLGLESTRQIPGFHDEPLKGKRLGQRSIRLNRSWRGNYIICDDGSVEFVEVQEIHKHDY